MKIWHFNHIELYKNSFRTVLEPFALRMYFILGLPVSLKHFFPARPHEFRGDLATIPVPIPPPPSSLNEPNQD